MQTAGIERRVHARRPLENLAATFPVLTALPSASRQDLLDDERQAT